jgi:hypothetical protein
MTQCFLDMPPVQILEAQDCPICGVVMPVRWWAAEHHGQLICSPTCFERHATLVANNRVVSFAGVTWRRSELLQKAAELEEEAESLRNEAFSRENLAIEMRDAADGLVPIG